jgi:hypothetical protein
MSASRRAYGRTSRDIAVVVLVAKRNKIDFLRPLVPQLEQTLLEVKAGELREVGI